MDIQAGDLVTCKYKDGTVIKEVAIDEDDVIRLEQKTVVKIERPVYEEVDSDCIHIEENEVIYERKELLTEEERYFLKLYIKLNTDFQEEKINYIYITDNFLHFNYGKNYDYEIEICKDMFSNLSKEKIYTLSELGLEEK